jgi:hypothetical protein
MRRNANRSAPHGDVNPSLGQLATDRLRHHSRGQLHAEEIRRAAAFLCHFETELSEAFTDSQFEGNGSSA